MSVFGGIMTFSQLKEQIADSGRAIEIDIIEKAYLLAEQSHTGQFRHSGEPFVDHPLHVASLLVDLGLDAESIAAALLHDVVEDTGVPLLSIKKQFGEEVAHLVDGVTKLGRIPFSSMEEEQAENLRKLLLAMSQDIRVMLIKLCDRLHNMRTAKGWSVPRQREKALETMEVYAPIAHRLGMNNFKEELEDLSIIYLDPVGCQEIEKLLERIDSNGDFIQNVSETIKSRILEFTPQSPVIESRVKSRYGIYSKLFTQNKSIEEIYDIYAIRIILDTITDCYNVLGIIHELYHPVPNRFKDYISTPKPNGYQSLQSTVVGRSGIPFEVQIRTHEMHHEAEYGIAAHWKYKLGIKGSDGLEERLTWVRQLLESQRESEDSVDIIRNIKSDLLPEDVYVFTPKGDVINLPAGSTVIDFAYAIHTAVGHRMVGAKVSGRIVPITYKIRTGEFVEILTGAENKGPSRDWLNIAQTSGARSKIRSWFKRERREENIAEGKTYYDRELRRNMVNIPQEKASDFAEDIAKRQGFSSAEDMYASIGYGGILMSRIMPKVREEYKKMIKQEHPSDETAIPIGSSGNRTPEGVIVEGIDNCLIRFAKCCNPLPGDDIIGFITRGQGVSIHKTDCVNVSAARHVDENSFRWVNVSWSDDIEESFRATLEIIMLDRNGLLAELTAALSNMHIPIFAMNVKTTADHRVFIVTTLGVANTEHLKNVMAKLKKIKDVQMVGRLNK